MEIFILIFIGISGVLFCGITAYPVDMIKDHLIMRLSATLALSCLHAYLWSMLLDYIGTKYGLPKTAAEAKTSSANGADREHHGGHGTIRPEGQGIIATGYPVRVWPVGYRVVAGVLTG